MRWAVGSQSSCVYGLCGGHPDFSRANSSKPAFWNSFCDALLNHCVAMVTSFILRTKGIVDTERDHHETVTWSLICSIKLSIWSKWSRVSSKTYHFLRMMRTYGSMKVCNMQQILSSLLPNTCSPIFSSSTENEFVPTGRVSCSSR